MRHAYDKRVSGYFLSLLLSVLFTLSLGLAGGPSSESISTPPAVPSVSTSGAVVPPFIGFFGAWMTESLSDDEWVETALGWNRLSIFVDRLGIEERSADSLIERYFDGDSPLTPQVLSQVVEAPLARVSEILGQVEELEASLGSGPLSTIEAETLRKQLLRLGETASRIALDHGLEYVESGLMSLPATNVEPSWDQSIRLMRSYALEMRTRLQEIESSDPRQVDASEFSRPSIRSLAARLQSLADRLARRLG